MASFDAGNDGGMDCPLNDPFVALAAIAVIEIRDVIPEQLRRHGEIASVKNASRSTE